MRDRNVRSVLHEQLRRASEDGTIIRNELGVCAGIRRIDVAVVNGELTGYEIKSDEDTLARLAGQAEAYGQVLDRAILVTTPRHSAKAATQLPSWWGILTAHQAAGGIHLEETRSAALNQSHVPFALAQLLWRDEALDELRSRQLARGLSSKPRYYAWLTLAEALPLSELRAVVRHRLKARQPWTIDR